MPKEYQPGRKFTFLQSEAFAGAKDLWNTKISPGMTADRNHKQ